MSYQSYHAFLLSAYTMVEHFMSIFQLRTVCPSWKIEKKTKDVVKENSNGGKCVRVYTDYQLQSVTVWDLTGHT